MKGVFRSGKAQEDFEEEGVLFCGFSKKNYDFFFNFFVGQAPNWFCKDVIWRKLFDHLTNLTKENLPKKMFSGYFCKVYPASSPQIYYILPSKDF